MMKNIWAITKKELLLYAYSPTAYVILALYVVLSGVLFASSVITTGSYIGPVFQIIVPLLMTFTPLITMRALAEERKLGTLEVLMTKSVTEKDIVLGKFLASFLFMLIMLAYAGVYIGIIIRYGAPDYGTIYTGFLGMILLTACFSALGVAMSAFTESQIIAAATTFTMILLFSLIGNLSGNFGIPEDSPLEMLSLTFNLTDFLRGIIDFRAIVYYLTFIIFWLFVAVKTIEIKKSR